MVSSLLEDCLADLQRSTAAWTAWEENVLEVTGRARADPRPAYNPDQALRAARMVAQRKLAEVIEGVRIEGTAVVRDAMLEGFEARSALRARVQGVRKKAR
jgi:hypothetical protein